MATIMFKVTVAASGTPGPLLGDGVKSTVTMLYPSTLKEFTTWEGTQLSVINRLVAAGRAGFMAARLQVIALNANASPAYFGARGAAKATMTKHSASGGMVLGSGNSESVNLGDFDIDVDANGEGFLVFAEVL